MESRVNAAVVLKALESQSKPLVKGLVKLETINTKYAYNEAMIRAKELKELAKIAEVKRRSLTDPLNQVIQDINKLFKPFTNMVAETEARVKTAMSEYLRGQEKAQARLEEDFTSGKIKKVSTFASKSAELIVGNSGVRKVWTAIEVDASKTPREYLVPNEALIKEALKSGKKVKGWEWKQVEHISI